ncbi:MAG: hypothetical protein Q7S80_01365 [bacterium]|nr:hypothetical protein [bacterium]
MSDECQTVNPPPTLAELQTLKLIVLMGIFRYPQESIRAVRSCRPDRRRIVEGIVHLQLDGIGEAEWMEAFERAPSLVKEYDDLFRRIRENILGTPVQP